MQPVQQVQRENKYQRDRTVPLGIAVGLLSFSLSFVTFRPNRIASGSGLFVWEVSPLFFLLVIPWVLCGSVYALFLLGSMKRERMVLAASVLGNAAVVGVFLFAGGGARLLVSPDTPFARTSMAFGAWTMVLAGYILIISSVRIRRGRVGALLSLSGIMAVAVLFATGFMNELSIVKEYLVRKDRFLEELGRHLFLSGTAVFLGAVIGIPLGIAAFRRRAVERPVFFIVNTVQTIPSLALFGLMIAPLALLTRRFPLLRELGIRGIGSTPALIALTLYALLPIVRNTYTSLKVLDPAVVESALGMGMGKLQLLRMVEIPISLPVVMSGIRVSMVQAVGNTTVAALIGAGGFGVFVFQGLGQAAFDLILLGTLPVVVLAVLIDRVMQHFIRFITPRGLGEV